MATRETSIRAQLLRALMLTSISALLLTVAGLIIYERQALRGMLAERLTLVARVIAGQSVAPLAFQSQSDAEETLAALAVMRGVEAAALYDQKGRLFAWWPAGTRESIFPPAPESDGYRFADDQIVVVQSVTRAGNRLGTFYLHSDLSVITWRIRVFAAIALAVMGGSLLVSYLLSKRLQAGIARPVLALADTAQSITQSRDYASRAPKLTGGELGLLTDAFNGMLEEIQRREVELRSANQQAEQRAHEAEEGRRLLAALMNNINEGITITAGPPDFSIAVVSRYGLKMTGRLEAGLTGMPSGQHQANWGLFLPDGVTRPEPEQMPLFRATRRGETVENAELILRSADGTAYSLLVNAAPIRDAAGHIVAGINSWRDVTELKRTEAELRRLKENLELRVQERTAELTAANRDMEAFTYSVSHDLRAPLRHMMSFTKLLENSLGAHVDGKGRRHIRVVMEAGKRMDTLIDELLKLSRVGQAPLHETDVSLRELVDEARQQLASEMGDRMITWAIGPLPVVQGDAALLRSVFVNLLSNALKYTRGREPALIELGCRTEPGEVICHVRDNGAGFDMRFADKLFRIFQRLHRAEDFEGTGIGLASVRRIIERHHGRIWAEGAVGQGATFYFALPARN